MAQVHGVKAQLCLLYARGNKRQDEAQQATQDCRLLRPLIHQNIDDQEKYGCRQIVDDGYKKVACGKKNHNTIQRKYDNGSSGNPRGNSL